MTQTIVHNNDRKAVASWRGGNVSVPERITERLGTELVNQAMLESLLFGVLLRGTLTNAEKEFLDNLSPERAFTFLMQEERSFHPENVRLFPMTVIETLLHQRGEAVFTHRYRPEGSLSREYLILTALLNPSEAQPMVFGFFGPAAHLAQDEMYERFHRLVQQFRTAYHIASRMARKIEKHHTAGQLLLVVNRSSGRVVFVNDAALRLFPKGESIIGEEFGHIKQTLLSLLPGNRLKISHLNEGELYLSLIEVTARQEAKGPSPAWFFDTLQGKSERLFGSLQKLETLCDEKTSGEILAHVRKITADATEYDYYVKCMSFLGTYDELELSEVNVLDELEHAVTVEAARINHTRRIERSGVAEPVTVTAPRHMFGMLFDSILLMHLKNLEMPGNTIISMKTNRREEKLVLVFETDSFPSLAKEALDVEWLNCARGLAAKLGVTMTNRSSAQDYKIVTSVTIPFERKTE